MDLIWIVPVSGLGTTLFALWLARDVLSRDAGSPEMQAVASTIFEGATAFLWRQYTTIAKLAIVTTIVIGLLVGYFDDSVKMGIYTAGAFLVGAAASALAGIIGMYVSVKSNVRCAAAATKGLREAIAVAIRGGAVSGFLVVALSLLGVAGIFAVYSRLLGNPVADTPFLIVGFAFGASFVALFAQLGGGIFTKAADVGADLVGKVEAGIPEDDPRNAAVVADLVGDNVGDCAGRGADLLESTAAENIGAMILGIALYKITGQVEWIVFPLVVRAFGLFASMAGIISVPFFTRERQHPFTPLTYGYYVAVGLSALFLLIVTRVMMGDQWDWFFLAGLIGLATSIAFVYITQYYTESRWPPVRRIADASRTGPATNILTGMAVGFETTGTTAITIGLALILSFVLGEHSGMEGGGLFGTAVAAMGMLMPAAYILALDTFGPITDNANGIIEMAGASPQAREITDSLDAVGNTTKALTKGYALGSAGLAAFLLFSAYIDKVKDSFSSDEGSPFFGLPVDQIPFSVDLSRVDVFVGALLGVMLVFVFSSLAIKAVSSTASKIIEEVRRQFRERPGIMAGTERPDYARAVDITTRAALREMVAPGILAVGMPILTGVIFHAARDTGAEAVAGLLMVGTIGGIVLASFMNNGGGAWDNAKKYIESGQLKVPVLVGGNPGHEEVLGKGSEAHKAAVVGDTVGDPFKDTAGPSLHVLVKLLSTITLVMAPIFM